MFKSVTLAAASMVIAMSGASIASADPLKVGFSPEAYPPFYEADAAGNWTGDLRGGKI